MANAHSMTLTSFTRDVWNPDVSGCLRVTMTINSLSSTVFHQVATALWKPELQLDQTAIEQMPSNIWMPCDSNFLFIFYIFTHLFYTTQLLSLHKRHISLLRDRNKSIYLSIIYRTYIYIYIKISMEFFIFDMITLTLKVAHFTQFCSKFIYSWPDDQNISWCVVQIFQDFWARNVEMVVFQKLARFFLLPDKFLVLFRFKTVTAWVSSESC